GVRVGLCSLFFLQAEDGIRHGHVTGVQTCALPISSTTDAGCRRPPTPLPWREPSSCGETTRSPARRRPPPPPTGSRTPQTSRCKIGRASCRERVRVAGVAGDGEKRK